MESFNENDDVIRSGYVQSESALDGVLPESVIMPILQIEARAKGLEVFLFKKEDLEGIWEVKNEVVGIALLAKDEDNAIHNVRNLRRCYLVELNK